MATECMHESCLTAHNANSSFILDRCFWHNITTNVSDHRYEDIRGICQAHIYLKIRTIIAYGESNVKVKYTQMLSNVKHDPALSFFT